MTSGYKELKAKIMNRYNQVPHLTQDTTRKSDKKARKRHIEEVSPFTAGDHKAAMNVQESMTNTKHKTTKMIHKEKHRLKTIFRIKGPLCLISYTYCFSNALAIVMPCLIR